MIYLKLREPMRKLLIIACLLSIAFAGFGQKKRKKDKAVPVVVDTNIPDTTNYKVLGAPMPAIKLVTRDNVVFTDRNMANKSNIFIIMFNPLCDHCQEEALMLEKNVGLFKKSNVVFMAASNMMQMLDFFESSTNISNYPKFYVGIDSSGFMTKTQRYENLPHMNIYDGDRKLIKMLNGDVPLDSLKAYIE